MRTLVTLQGRQLTLNWTLSTSSFWLMMVRTIKRSKWAWLVQDYGNCWLNNITLHSMPELLQTVWEHQEKMIHMVYHIKHQDDHMVEKKKRYNKITNKSLHLRVLHWVILVMFNPMTTLNLQLMAIQMFILRVNLILNELMPDENFRFPEDKVSCC